MRFLAAFGWCRNDRLGNADSERQLGNADSEGCRSATQVRNDRRASRIPNDVVGRDSGPTPMITAFTAR